MKPHIPLFYQFTSHALYLYKRVSTNIISVQCHYCETAAGNVSPASITHSSSAASPHTPSPPTRGQEAFCVLIGRYKLQVITTRFFTAQTIGIYSSGFLFKLSAGGIAKPRCLFSNDQLYISITTSNPAVSHPALNRMNIDLLKRIYLFHALSKDQLLPALDGSAEVLPNKATAYMTLDLTFQAWKKTKQ